MKTLALLLTLAVALHAQPKKEKRSAGAHEHGAGKLDIAMEGLKGKWEWEIPMESLTGFEHQAKSAADKKKVADAEQTIRTKIGAMSLLPAAAGCAITVSGVEVAQHGNHSEMHTHGAITCKKPLTGDVTFAFGKFFPGIHSIKVQFVSDTVQTGAEIEHDRGSLRIGK
jgi:hypothetical protein